VSGIIKAHNSASPFTDGWIYQMEPSNWLREIEFMSMADKYRSWINGEFNRLKDFLAQTLTGPRTEMSYVVLQDGGMLKEGLLADMDPTVWEDFQNNFLDTAK